MKAAEGKCHAAEGRAVTAEGRAETAEGKIKTAKAEVANLTATMSQMANRRGQVNAAPMFDQLPLRQSKEHCYASEEKLLCCGHGNHTAFKLYT